MYNGPVSAKLTGQERVRNSAFDDTCDRPDPGPVNELCLRIERRFQGGPVRCMQQRGPERQIKLPDDLDGFHDFRRLGNRLLEAFALISRAAREGEVDPRNRPGLEDRGIELCNIAHHRPRVFEPPQPVKRSAMRKLDAARDVLDRGPRAGLQEAEDLEVNPVKSGPGRRIEWRKRQHRSPVVVIWSHRNVCRQLYPFWKP